MVAATIFALAGAAVKVLRWHHDDAELLGILRFEWSKKLQAMLATGPSRMGRDPLSLLLVVKSGRILAVAFLEQLGTDLILSLIHI